MEAHSAFKNCNLDTPWPDKLQRIEEKPLCPICQEEGKITKKRNRFVCDNYECELYKMTERQKHLAVNSIIGLFLALELAAIALTLVYMK